MGNLLEYSGILKKNSESNNYWNVEIFPKKIISKIFFFFLHGGGGGMKLLGESFWNILEFLFF